LFVDVYGGRILRLSSAGTLSTIHTDPALRPAGIAVHKDGRIFVAAVGDFRTGSVIALNPDGSDPRTIVPPSAGFVPDDLVFDRHGGFYFTDRAAGPRRQSFSEEHQPGLRARHPRRGHRRAG